MYCILQDHQTETNLHIIYRILMRKSICKTVFYGRAEIDHIQIKGAATIIGYIYEKYISVLMN